MKKAILTLPLVAIAWSAPALAGEEILYAEAPDFVAPVDLGAAIAADEDVVVFDRHYRMENGVVQQYTDFAVNIRSSESLRQFGTVQLGWLPDKGDLTIHRLHIIRGGETIDVLANGAQPQILRRERQLEQASLDGMLTAAIPVAGLQVGDILRYSISTTLNDQAMGGEMQAEAVLTPRPAEMGFGRVVMSWPSDAPISWRAVGQAGEHGVVSKGGYDMIEVALPIDEPEAMPDDAPGRYLLTPAIQAGTFASWEEVSRVMAPHYKTEGTIDPAGPIAAQVARIRRAQSDKLGQAALALQVVQDEINYLMNGMDGGNYLPQSPEQTWELRYGDCKAKGLLLLAMLRELDIDAEAVLVDTENSDAASVILPLPAAFNHMIVRANIDGLPYYLDGTSSGTRRDTLFEVPDYAYALPLVEGGAALARVEQRWPKAPDQVVRITYDMGAGVDQPALYDIEVETRGIYGAQLRELGAQTNALQLIGNAHQYLSEFVNGVLYEAEIDFDEETGVGTMRASGILPDAFALDRANATHKIASATSNWQFAPDRARRAWREIPYVTGGPLTIAYRNTYLLPDGGAGASLTGTRTLDETSAATRFNRTITIDGARVLVEDGYSFVPTEIAAADLAGERSKMRQLISGDPSIAIADPRRSWELTDRELTARMARFEEPLKKLLMIDAGNPGYPMFAAFLRAQMRDYEEALQLVEDAMHAEESAQGYAMRAQLYTSMGRHEDALVAAERAHDLQGDLASAIGLANAMAQVGQADEALDMLDSLGLSGDEANSVATLWADISGKVGRQDEAWDRLDQALLDKPGDSSLLNSQCWLAGTWQTNLESARSVCDEAVSAANHSAATLDSRALVHYRAGDTAAALADLDAALRKQPGLAASLYLRGVIRLEQGDGKGREDITHAMRIAPVIGEQYREWGIVPAS